MPTRKILLPLLIGALLSAPAAFADDESHKSASEALLKTMQVDKQLQGAIDQTLDLQVKSNPTLMPFREVMKTFLLKHMSWDNLKEDFIKIYVDAFTEEELGEIKAFYETPVGKKMIAKQPELMAKGMQLGAKRVQDNQSELREMIQAEAAKK